jgi:hypothetical protein
MPVSLESGVIYGCINSKKKEMNGAINCDEGVIDLVIGYDDYILIGKFCRNHSK